MIYIRRKTSSQSQRLLKKFSGKNCTRTSWENARKAVAVRDRFELWSRSSAVM